MLIRVPDAGVGQGWVIVFIAADGGSGNSPRQALTVADIERIDPDPGSFTVGTPLMVDLNRKFMWADGQPADAVKHHLIGRSLRPPIYLGRLAVQGDSGKAIPSIPNANPADARSSEGDYRSSARRVRQGCAAPTIIFPSIGEPGSTVGDTGISLLNTRGPALLGPAERCTHRKYNE